MFLSVTELDLVIQTILVLPWSVMDYFTLHDG